MYAYCFRIDIQLQLNLRLLFLLTIAKPKPIEFTFEDFFQNVLKMLIHFKASNEPVLFISAWSYRK
jgi:hypothetical protein